MSSFPRMLPAIATALTLAIAGVSGCTGSEDGLIGIGGKQPTPKPSASGLMGDVGNEGPGSSATPTPTPSPTPSPTPTPQVVAQAVSISPATLELSVPMGAGTGAPANYPTSGTLTAVVAMSDGGTSNSVTWVSLTPGIATVNSAGVVTVVAPGSGSGPWTVQIQATSADQHATGIRNVTVTAEGDVALDVQ